MTECNDMKNPTEIRQKTDRNIGLHGVIAGCMGMSSGVVDDIKRNVGSQHQQVMKTEAIRSVV